MTVKHSGHRKRMIQQKRDNAEKWYYDANALEKGTESYGEIINQHIRYNKKMITSHLSVGEAWCNCRFKKDGKGNDKLAAFMKLLDALEEGGVLDIIGNDDIEKHFDKVREKFGRLTITDAIHLSTAFRHGCSVLKSKDHDLWGISKTELKGFVKENNYKEISIVSG